MNKRLNRILIFVVAAPVLLMAWLGVRTARIDRERVQSRLADTALQQLTERSALLTETLDEILRESMRVLETLKGVDSPEQLREPSRSHPLARQLFVMQNERVVFPDPLNDKLNARELAFLERTASIWDSGETFIHETDSYPQITASNDQRMQIEATIDSGWHTWFWDNGLNFIIWRSSADGSVSGIELERAAIISRVISALPATTLPEYSTRLKRGLNSNFRTRLVNARGETIYQWGLLEDTPDQKPVASISLNEPLSAWRLEQYIPPVVSGPLSAASLSIILAIAAISIAIAFCVMYIYREHTRMSKEAAKKVTFVNQVSHELKTPLTNIQMYAELLQNRVDDSDKKSVHYIEVVSSESRRLARMINNVLAFARHQRGKLKLQLTESDVEEVIGCVVETFTPSLQKQNISIQLKQECQRTALFDRDVLEQILGNLLSNVEKYAGEGAKVVITTECNTKMLEVVVHDNGPGIPHSQAVDIFEPFVRLNDRLTEGVSGTGIGLSIARELARLHHGDLTLIPSETGASFKITISLSEV